MSTSSKPEQSVLPREPMDQCQEENRGSCRSIGDIINRGKRRRRKALVRRNSVHRDALLGFFRSFDPQNRGQLLKAAERYDNLTKSKGKRNGALGYTGLKVLKALLEFIDYKSGRLEPSYLALCKKACLSVSAVSAALKRLVMHGFLELKRRYEETGDTDGGPTVRQITNAYRISLPAVAAKTLRSILPAPLSDDERERRRMEHQERERMICQLPEWQQPIIRANVTDPQLSDVLESLGRAVFAIDEPHVQP